MFNRVILKISGEVLAGDFGAGSTYRNFSEATIERIVLEIKEVVLKGCQVGLVIGGGNIWRGRSSNSSMDRTKADQIGMLATVMNGIYLADMFRQKGMKAIVFTPFTLGTMTHVFSKEAAEACLTENGVAIFVGGTGHPFFSSDTIAALRAAELDCECILYAKNIDGIYSADPAKDKTAIKYKDITYKEIMEKNLQAIDIAAISICESRKIASVAFDMRVEHSIVIAGENNDEIYKIGTKVNY